MSSLKIPSDIRKVINSSSGKEPIAFVDVFEERGDFDVIDTHNQFLALDDAAIGGDVNVDFDRKPGFAVLAPGKRVDSLGISVLAQWGFGNIDWTPIGGRPSFTSMLNLGLSENNSSGSSFLLCIITGISLGVVKTIILSSSDSGKNFIANEINSNNILIGAEGTATQERFSNFDNIIAVARNNNFGKCYMFNKDSASPILYDLDPLMINTLARRMSCANIKGMFFYGLMFSDGSVGNNSASVVISSVKEASVAFSTNYSFSLLGGDFVKSINIVNNKIIVIVQRNDPAQTIDIFSSAFSSDHTAYSFTKVNSVSKPTGWNATSVARVVSGKLLLFQSSASQIAGNKYFYSTDDGVTFSIGTLPANSDSIESNAFDKGNFVVFSKSSKDIYETIDGINWTTISGVTQNYYYVNNTEFSVLPIPYKDKISGDIVIFRHVGGLPTVNVNSVSSSNHPPVGVSVTNSFDYDVLVEDVYVVDSGRGKK